MTLNNIMEKKDQINEKITVILERTLKGHQTSKKHMDLINIIQ